ncbi:MAG: hypothetical protein NVSMB56_11910 [Pyrinomonadaceae bacterium]
MQQSGTTTPPKKAPESKPQLKFNSPVSNKSNERTKSVSIASSNAVARPPVPHVRIEQINLTNISEAGLIYRVVLMNDGATMAKDITVNERLPDDLQFVSSEPLLKIESTLNGVQRFVWHVSELAPNKTAVLQIKVRRKPGLSNERALSYKDANGKIYP